MSSFIAGDVVMSSVYPNRVGIVVAMDDHGYYSVDYGGDGLQWSPPPDLVLIHRE